MRRRDIGGRMREGGGREGGGREGGGREGGGREGGSVDMRRKRRWHRRRRREVPGRAFLTRNSCGPYPLVKLRLNMAPESLLLRNDEHSSPFGSLRKYE